MRTSRRKEKKDERYSSRRGQWCPRIGACPAPSRNCSSGVSVLHLASSPSPVRVDSRGVAEFLLDPSNGLEVGGALKGVPAHEEELDEVPRHVSPCDVESSRQMRERVALVNRDDVGDSVSRVDNHARLES